MKPLLHIPSVIPRCKTLCLFFMLLVSSAGFAQKKDGKEYSGVEASRIIRNASFVKERLGTPYPALVRLDASAKIIITEFIPWLKQSVKTNDNLNFKLLKQESDELGFMHYRYEQTFKNIPVEHTFYYAHVRNGYISHFNGSAVNITDDLSAKPSLTEAGALKAALRKIGAKKYMWEDTRAEADLKEQKKNKDATYYPKGELYWLLYDGVYKLTYRFDIQSAAPDFLQRIYINAQTGATLLTVPLESTCDIASVTTIFNGIHFINTENINNQNTWGLKDDCQASHMRVRNWNSTDCNSNNPTDILSNNNTWTTQDQRFGGSVLWGIRESYGYWKNVRLRNSYDNNNGNVDAFINAVFDDDNSAAGCQPTTDNASMNNNGRMKIGLGSGGTLQTSWGTLDIIGHEYTHAVTGSSAGLIYMNESGALNESFSDIFGEATEFYSTSSVDWLVGAQRTSNGLGIRSLKDPDDSAYLDPATYLGSNWYSGTVDFGGVHTNSGVQNFWFYLLSAGGSGTNDFGNTYNVSGIGILKAAAIAARNLTVYLGPSSGYFDARNNSIQAAIDLYGECSNEVKQVTNAWFAVNVGSGYFDANVVIESNYNGRHVSCFNSCNATVAVYVSNGDSPTFEWSHGPTSQTLTGVCPGTYTVKVTNENGSGCSVTKSVTVNNTPELIISPAPATNFNGYGVSCFGGSNGKAAANASGGTAPYSYSWSNGQTGATITNLPAGTYNVTVTDKNGCSKSGSVTITEPPQLITAASVTSNYNGYSVRCNGGADGTATTSTNGGVTPYSYAWSNGQTSQNATGLMATTYTVTVTDANGCTASSSVTLTQPPPLTIDAGANKIVYFGYPDSSCTNLTATGQGGGVPPYTIQWSTGSNNATINVCPQTTTVYAVTISDANGCSVTDAVTVCVIDVRCGNNLDKVTICHYNNSNTSPFETLCVSLNAAASHFTMHPEDQLAACGTVKVCNDAARGLMDGITSSLYKPATTFIEAYPNPLSGTGIIKFLSTVDDRGTIKLFDVSGKEISVLYEGRLQANFMNHVLLNSAELSKGVYFVQLTTQKGTSERVKLVVAR